MDDIINCFTEVVALKDQALIGRKRGHENDSASFVDFLHPEYYLGFVTDEEMMAESQPLKAFIFEGVSEWVYI